MKKYALYTRKLGVYGGCWLFSSNLVLSAKSDSQVSVGHFLFSAQISQFCFQQTSGIALCNSFRVFMEKETGIEPEGLVLMQRRWLRGNLGHLPGHWLFGLCVTLSGRRNGRWC